MKKVLLVTFLSVFGLTSVSAQDIQFGLKGGLSFSSIYGDNIENSSTVTGFNFGLLAEIPISEKFSFQPELLYSGQGYSTGSGTNNLVALDYLNIPLMGKYYLTKGLSIEAGPQIGFLLSANEKSLDIDVKDTFESIDFGVNVGLGYKFDNGLNFGARYNLGLADINKTDDSSIKNGVFQISAGYFF